MILQLIMHVKVDFLTQSCLKEICISCVYLLCISVHVHSGNSEATVEM